MANMFKGIRSATIVALMCAFSLGAASKKAVQPPGTRPGMPFSPGILSGGTLYVSGTIGNDPKTGKVPAEFEAEVRQAFENINAVLKQAGYTFDDAVSVQVYLTDISLFPRMNKVYMTFFKEPRPARTTVGVAALASPDAKIEITVTAQK